MTGLIDKRKGVKEIRLDKIVLESNYRTNFAFTDIAELGMSMKNAGQLQTVIVNQTPDGRYHLIAVLKWRAALYITI